MQEFLDALSSSYATNKKLLLLEEIGESSGKDKIIGLLVSGIGPDDVASLFLLIARALVSGEVSLPGRTKWFELASLVRKSLLGALNEKFRGGSPGA